jgi:hypothetical protein
MRRSWGKRHVGAGCAGLLLGIVTVLGVEVHWINKDMQRMDEIRDAALVRALEEGPSQLDYDRMCGVGKKDRVEKRKLACERMEFLMQRAKERREAESAREAPGARP